MSKPIIATTTLATFDTLISTTRAECAIKTVKEARRQGYRVIAVDGGSPPEYVDTLRKHGAEVHHQISPGMGNARREALHRAFDAGSDDSAIIWTEPEKYPLLPLLVAPLRVFSRGDYDLVLLRRRSLESYPPEQAMAYQLIALATKYLTGIDCDFGWGPMILGPATADYFLKYESAYGDLWDSIHCPKLAIIKDGLSWTVESIDYRHSAEQTAAETGMELFAKRIDQVRQLVTAISEEVVRLGIDSHQAAPYKQFAVPIRQLGNNTQIQQGDFNEALRPIRT